MYFTGANHREQFKAVVEQLRSPSNRYLAAAYLLTARKNLWSKMFGNRLPADIIFDIRKVGSLKPGDYAVFMAAKDLYRESKHFTFEDILDEELFEDSEYRLVSDAIKIKRRGMAAL